MDRDHFLFVFIGLLVGFIGGYLAHEVMQQHQPVPASRLAASAGAAGGGQAAMPQAAGGGEAPQAPMEQVQRLRQYVADNPDDLDAVRLLANLNYDISNWSRAAELYERFLEGHPEDADVRVDLGACYRNMNRHQDALEQFREVLKRDPEHWQALYNEVLVLAFDLGDGPAAREAMARLQTSQPDNEDVSRLAAELDRRGI